MGQKHRQDTIEDYVTDFKKMLASSHNRSMEPKEPKSLHQDDLVKKKRMDEEIRDSRKDKSEKEKDRRNHLNGLFNELGGLLGVAGQNKSQILANAREFLKDNSRSNKKS